MLRLLQEPCRRETFHQDDMIPPQQGQPVCGTQLYVSGWGTDGLWSFLERFGTAKNCFLSCPSESSLHRPNLLLADLPPWDLLSEEQSTQHGGGFLFAKLTMSLSVFSPHPSPRRALGIAFHAVLATQASPLGRKGEGPEPADCHDINISSIVHAGCQWFNYQLTKLLAI